jgi:hypothetical protein
MPNFLRIAVREFLRAVFASLVCILALIALPRLVLLARHSSVHAQNATVNGVPNQVISMTTFGCYDTSGNLHQCRKILATTTSSASTGAWSFTASSVGCTTLIGFQVQPQSTAAGASAATFPTTSSVSLTGASGSIIAFQSILGLGLLPVIVSPNAQTVYGEISCY